jgi:hypothetical protein
LGTKAADFFDRNVRGVSDDFRRSMAAIATLAAPHTHAAKGLGTVRFRSTGLLNNLAQLANADRFAATNNGVVR